MRDTPSAFWINLFDTAEPGVRGITGEIDGEPVFALLFKLPPEVTPKLIDDSAFEVSWRWSGADQGREAGLALDLETALAGQSLRSDRLVFPMGQEESVAQLRCLMRQACLPTILLDHRLNELSRAGFDWTAEDRSEIASLVGVELARSYQVKESLQSPASALRTSK